MFPLPVYCVPSRLAANCRRVSTLQCFACSLAPSFLRKRFRIDFHESPFPAREHRARSVANLASRSKLRPFFATSHPSTISSPSTGTGLTYSIVKLRRHRVNRAEAAHLAHHFIEQRGDDPAVNESRAALVFRAEPKCATNAPRRVVLLERELHAARVCAAAAKAGVRLVRLQQHRVRIIDRAPRGLPDSILRCRAARLLQFAASAYSPRDSECRARSSFHRRWQIPAATCSAADAAVKIAARNEQHAAFARVNQQLAGIESRRQR